MTKKISQFYAGFTFSLVLWLIWCLSKNRRPLNVLAEIPEGSHNWLLLIQCSPCKFQHLPPDPQPELINTQIRMSSSSKSTFTTHIHVLQKSALGLWEAGQDSEVLWTLQMLCTKCVHGPTPYPQLLKCAAAVSPVTFSSQRYRSGVTRRLSAVREGKAELFIHLSVLTQMHQDCSKVGSPFQLWQYCSSESKTQTTVLLQKSTLKCCRNIIKTSPSPKNLLP